MTDIDANALVEARLKEAADNLEALQKQHEANKKKIQDLKGQQEGIENQMVYWTGRTDSMRALLADAAKEKKLDAQVAPLLEQMPVEIDEPTQVGGLPLPTDPPRGRRARKQKETLS